LGRLGSTDHRGFIERIKIQTITCNWHHRIGPS
jgi:hypothetical protein